MPTGPVPERFHDLLVGTALGSLATVGAEGRPQVNPVWFIAGPDRFFLSMKADTAKLRNVRANPHVALSIGDPRQPFRYVELRGTVVGLELFETVAWVNELARKYTGADFTGGVDGERGYMVTVRVDSWSGQG